MQTLQQIISGCHSGNPRSQIALYDKFHASMRHTCHKILKDCDLAAECLQIGYCKIFANIEHISTDIAESQLAAWMHRVMRNTCIDMIRNDSRRKTIPLSCTYDVADVGQAYDTSIDETYDKLMQLVPYISDGYRAVFELRVTGMKHEAIAAALNISIGTAKSNFHKAKSRLLTLYEKKFADR